MTLSRDNEADHEFMRCEPEVDGICRMTHDHALHGGSISWPVRSFYAALRRMKPGDPIPKFAGYDADYGGTP